MKPKRQFGVAERTIVAVRGILEWFKGSVRLRGSRMRQNEGCVAGRQWENTARQCKKIGRQ